MTGISKEVLANPGAVRVLGRERYTGKYAGKCGRNDQAIIAVIGK